VTHTTQRRATLAILASAVLWGTWWLPLREIHQLGLGGVTAITGGYAAAALLMLPVAAWQWRKVIACGWRSVIAGVGLATAMALWSDGLVHGNVARVTLLFYLAPIWGTLLARAVLKEPITALRLAAILLGLTGAAVLLGGPEGPPLPRDKAEWYGLIAGMTYSVALLFVNKTADRPDIGRTFLLLLFAAPIYWLLGTGDPVAFTAGDLLGSMPWLILFAALWIVPVIWLTLYGGSRLDPGRVAILLILEIVFAITTAAIFAGEAFGWQEAAGALAIIIAGVIEDLPRLTRAVRNRRQSGA